MNEQDMRDQLKRQRLFRECYVAKQGHKLVESGYGDFPDMVVSMGYMQWWVKADHTYPESHDELMEKEITKERAMSLLKSDRYVRVSAPTYFVYWKLKEKAMSWEIVK